MPMVSVLNTVMTQPRINEQQCPPRATVSHSNRICIVYSAAMGLHHLLCIMWIVLLCYSWMSRAKQLYSHWVFFPRIIPVFHQTQLFSLSVSISIIQVWECDIVMALLPCIKYNQLNKSFKSYQSNLSDVVSSGFTDVIWIHFVSESWPYHIVCHKQEQESLVKPHS